jgi:hypothetical protein
MKTKLIAALLIASSAALTAPAFASNYGPAPFYLGKIGAPASQRGQSAQTLAAEQVNGEGVNRGFGGVQAGSSRGGARATFAATDPLFRHH